MINALRLTLLLLAPQAAGPSNVPPEAVRADVQEAGPLLVLAASLPAGAQLEETAEQRVALQEIRALQRTAES